MATEWLPRLKHQAALAQKTSEGVERILSAPGLNEDQVRRAMLAVRDGSSSFQQFSSELREADLDGPIYKVAAEIEDKWQELVEALLGKLNVLQGIETAK